MKLHIDIYKNGTHYFAEYATFTVGAESTGFVLNDGGYSGTAGDCMYFNNGMQFSIYDRVDNGSAAIDIGSWWYNGGTYAGLNNKVLTNDGFT